MIDVFIRPYELEDADDLYEAGRESVAEVYPWLPWCHPEYTIEESEEWLVNQLHERGEGTRYAFAIVGSDDSFLGGCGLNGIDPQTKMANLGYWVRSSVMGQGVAARAVNLLARWAFENTDLKRLEIRCAIGNIRSQRVAEKSGAVREGFRESCLEFHRKQHDAIIYAIERPPDSATGDQ